MNYFGLLMYDWSKPVYAVADEEVFHNISQPKEQPVNVTTYADLILCRNIPNGKAVTGILYFVNKNPFDWYSKKQVATETATYGAEELYVYIPDKINSADILSKHWRDLNIWNMLRLILLA